MLGNNLEAVSKIITDAAKAGAKMIFLPEASDFITKADEVASLTKPLAENEFVQGVRAKAKETGVWVSVGVHETVCALKSCPFIIISVVRICSLVRRLSSSQRVWNQNVVLIRTS